MLEEGSAEDSEDFGMEDPVCIDGVIFYGPMTDRERMVKERFERQQKEKVKTQLLPPLSNKEFSANTTMASEESKIDKNDISIYESFSIDESKYESFNDSLDERKFLNPNEINFPKISPEQINVNKRRFQSKQMIKGSLCDSLEDIHSLASNVDKLSISEEIENINIHEKNPIYDDSLRNDICLEKKNFNSIDHNFDDDSLAILDFEKAFDDSLEEADLLSLSQMDNVVILRNGENNTEISVENLPNENVVAKNLFETSVEVIYENAGYVENSEERSGVAPKQLSITADSLSISENMSKDSLDGLPAIPKYSERKSYKASLNREKYDVSRKSYEVENYSCMKNMNDKDSNPAYDHNLLHNISESVSEQFNYIKRNASNSNDTIVIEDSLINSPDATIIKKENSITCSYPTSNDILPVFNNYVMNSDESINKTDTHPNDTICIDDSFNQLQNTDVAKDELHLTDTLLSGNKKNCKQIQYAESNSSDAIDVKNSVEQPLNIKREKNTHKQNISEKSINSKLCIQNHIKHEPENLESKNHPNDTICIDDSFNQLQNTSLNEDELCSFQTELPGIQKINGTNDAKLNDTLDNSFTMLFQHMVLNSKNEESSSCLKRRKEKSIPRKDSKSHIQSPIKHQLGQLENSNEAGVSNLNGTVCIDSSPVEPVRMKMSKKSPSKFNCSKKSSKSPLQNKNIDSQFHTQSPAKHKLEHLEEKNEATVSNLNNTIYIDSSPIEPLKIKIEKKSPSCKASKKSGKSPCQAKNIEPKFHIHSDVKHELQHLEEENKATISNLNNTIYIDSSPIEPLRIKKEKKSSSMSNSSKKSSKSPSEDKISGPILYIRSPVKPELQHLEQTEAGVSNLNDTIYIDSSPVESFRNKMDKTGLSSCKFSKSQSPGLKNRSYSNQKQFISRQTAEPLDSPLEDVTKSNVSGNNVKDPKNVLNYFKEALVLPKDLLKDSNLKLQLEVVFDENQGVNIISVSAVDQGVKNITPSAAKEDNRRSIVRIENQGPDVSDKNKGTVTVKVDEIYGSSIVSDKVASKGFSPDIPGVKTFVTKSCSEKNKIDIYSNEKNDASGHNVQLLEALDLHDTSCSFIDSGFVQSGDSIMPLNLCIRSRSPETNCQNFTKFECKENIPLFDRKLVMSEDRYKSKKRSSTKAYNKTSKQLNWNADVKKSGNKANSITKIPVRKMNNLFFTPIHAKESKDIKTGLSTEKIFKNPLVKSVSAADNLTSAKPQETPRKHHFCSVRNSISRVPKSTPRSIPKKFQNIESPIAKYIGKPQTYTPLKTTHRYDGNLIVGNAVKTSKQAVKTPNSGSKSSPHSAAGKL